MVERSVEIGGLVEQSIMKNSVNSVDTLRKAIPSQASESWACVETMGGVPHVGNDIVRSTAIT